jgi:hypothetical protein
LGGRGREIEEGDRHLVLPGLDPLHEGLGDLPLLFLGEGGPAVSEILSAGEDLVPGQGLDPEEVHLPLKPGGLVSQLLQPLLQGPAEVAEALDRDLVGLVAPVGLVHLGPDLPLLGLEGFEVFDLALEGAGKLVTALSSAYGGRLPDGVDRLWYADTSIPTDIEFIDLTVELVHARSG